MAHRGLDFGEYLTPTEEAEARAYIADAGYSVLDGRLLERPAYRKAQNIGHAITETSYRNLNIKADALIQALIDKIGEENGKSNKAKKKKYTRRAANS